MLTGATVIMITTASRHSMFQSSPVIADGCDDDRQDVVDMFKAFQSSPVIADGCDYFFAASSEFPSLFQSSPVIADGCDDPKGCAR